MVSLLWKNKTNTVNGHCFCSIHLMNSPEVFTTEYNLQFSDRALKLAITRWHLSLVHGPGALRLLWETYGCFKPEHVLLTTIVSFAIYSVVALPDCISIRAASYALSLLPTHLIILHLHAFLSNNVSLASVLLLCPRRLLMFLLIRFALASME